MYNDSIPVLVLTFVIVMFAAAAIWIGRLSAKRAGISEDTPACAHCLYSLGGWSTSTCPECGSDVRKVGVRVGPQSTQYILIFLVVVIGIVGVGWCAAAFFGWLFLGGSVHLYTHWTSLCTSNYDVCINSQWEWRRFPYHYEFSGNIEFIRLGLGRSGAWRNAGWQGSPPMATTNIVLNDVNRLPTRESIMDAIAIVAPDTPQKRREQQCDAIVNGIRGQQSFSKENMVLRQFYNNAPPANLFNGGTASNCGMGAAPLPLFGCTALLVLTFIVIGVRLVNRYCHSGWRPPKRCEWEIPREC